jgi:hypothetical protein
MTFTDLSAARLPVGHSFLGSTLFRGTKDDRRRVDAATTAGHRSNAKFLWQAKSEIARRSMRFTCDAPDAVIENGVTIH